MKKVLLVIDLQNDYFPGGKFPLWNTEGALDGVERAIQAARTKDVPVVLIRHIVDTAHGAAPFFGKGTHGAELHRAICAAAPDAPVIDKAFADSFHETRLEATLTELGATELLVCGMMTHNCVTHTAISKTAEKYDVTILPDACTTVSEMVHLLALHAVSTRVKLTPVAQAM